MLPTYCIYLILPFNSCNQSVLASGTPERFRRIHPGLPPPRTLRVLVQLMLEVVLQGQKPTEGEYQPV